MGLDTARPRDREVEAPRPLLKDKAMVSGVLRAGQPHLEGNFEVGIFPSPAHRRTKMTLEQLLMETLHWTMRLSNGEFLLLLGAMPVVGLAVGVGTGKVFQHPPQAVRNAPPLT